ncbi:hypothetical protein N7512_006074 [Penicillium capsulatum]|nr:hypothetical protein N7512_006074 [Penicillium capsulatum]
MEEEYDLLIIADATASMGSYLTALNTSLPQIISISALTGSFSRIGLLAYRDYLDDLLEWSGWLHQNDSGEAASQSDLITLAISLAATGGGDYPEATKTAFAKAYEVMRPEAKTVILLYTDAPPHANIASMERGSNGEAEKSSLLKEDSYGGFGPSFVDWVSATNMLRHGDKNAQVFSILERSIGRDAAYYNFMSTMTGGSCILLNESSPEIIAKVTVEILLAWMGVEKTPAAGPGKGDEKDLSADLSRYISGDGIKKVESESSKETVRFMRCVESTETTFAQNIAETQLNADALKRYLPKRSIPVQNFAERWKTDGAYRNVAIEHLLTMIHTDVRAIALNPVFGTLWRTICNDRAYDRREEVLEAFSTSLNKLSNSDDRARMKIWLEESYDFSADVLAMINKVPQEEQYPCVVLDPTQSFPTFDAEADADEGDKPITDLTRGDLLEIGRSCNATILRRLGRILTRLTFINSAEELPEHLAKTSLEQVPRIPLALTEQKYGREFWKVLLHLIVPGTMLSARPAALVAALSLRLGMEFLFKPAVSQMLFFKDKWNDLATPENWTIGCMALLIDADEIYQRRQQYLGTNDQTEETAQLLNPSDRTLFEKLVAFKMLELNLDTPLTARVPWTPNKSIAPIGPLVTCRSCQYPRSVTIMGQSGKCGMCLATDYPTSAEKEARIKGRVSTDDTTVSEATWVECFDRSCRAQYIVYAVDALNVRAKCHYCRRLKEAKEAKRKAETAPVVQCKQCHNRMIWPKAYRPSTFKESEFICPPCMSGRDPAEDVSLAARKIAVENTFAWLIQDKKTPGTTPFENRSIFHTISAIGTDNFVSQIELFPSFKGPLIHLGKPIVNTESLISSLRETVANRQTAQTECSLCFSTFHPRDLNPACGRRGCLQRICTKCLNSWYKLNASGSIINTAALACPFCRRLPAARTLAKYGMGIHAVRDLANAVRDKGTMIYAWCRECNTAREYVARDCARGAPPKSKTGLAPNASRIRSVAVLKMSVARLSR